MVVPLVVANLGGESRFACNVGGSNEVKVPATTAPFLRRRSHWQKALPGTIECRRGEWAFAHPLWPGWLVSAPFSTSLLSIFPLFISSRAWKATSSQSFIFDGSRFVLGPTGSRVVTAKVTSKWRHSWGVYAAFRRFFTSFTTLATFSRYSLYWEGLLHQFAYQMVLLIKCYPVDY